MSDNENKKKRGVFFDVDYTVLSSNSVTLYVKYMIKRGEVGLFSLLQTTFYLIQYKLNLLNFELIADREMAKYKDGDEGEMIDICNRWFEEMVIDYIYPGARAKIEEHQSQGDELILLSAASVYLIRPLAEYFGIKHYLCNFPEVDEHGKFTGSARKPFCYGEGKIFWAEKFASEHDIDLSESIYYSDSITDLPVLERFGYPIVVNPDHLLRKEARQREWPIIEWKMS